MTQPLDARGLVALESALLRSASAMVLDPVEAKALVEQTLAIAGEESPRGRTARSGRGRVFRVLRQTYHSIERSHGRRSVRDAAVTALAIANRPTPLPAA